MLTPDEKNRYARHLLLPGFGEEAQIRLKKSRVLLIGAGGLGSPVSLYLTAAGVGHITIIDPDKVELSNLQRQILHNEQEVGEPKVNSAQRTLSSLNSQTSICLREEHFSDKNAEELINNHDLVIDGSDNFPTRFLVNDACFLLGKPLIYGSIFQYEGQLTVFNPTTDGPCYRCLVPHLPEASAVPNCTEAGVIGTLAGTIGTLQAMEALKFIAGVGTAPIGRMLYYNAWDTKFREISISKDPLCPLCSKNATIKKIQGSQSLTCSLNINYSTITARELKPLITPHSSIFLIDVREPNEYARSRIPGSQLIPLSTLKATPPSLPKETPLYVHCQSGIRSLKAIEILSKAGFKHLTNIEDGMNGWEETESPNL